MTKIKSHSVVFSGPRLARAYYLKEGLRVIFKLPLAEATEALAMLSFGGHKPVLPGRI